MNCRAWRSRDGGWWDREGTRYVHKLTVTLITIAPLFFYCWCVLYFVNCFWLFKLLTAFCFLFFFFSSFYFFLLVFGILHLLLLHFVTCRRNRIKWFVKIGAFAWYVCIDMPIEYIIKYCGENVSIFRIGQMIMFA